MILYEISISRSRALIHSIELHKNWQTSLIFHIFFIYVVEFLKKMLFLECFVLTCLTFSSLIYNKFGTKHFKNDIYMMGSFKFNSIRDKSENLSIFMCLTFSSIAYMKKIYQFSCNFKSEIPWPTNWNFNIISIP